MIALVVIWVDQDANCFQLDKYVAKKYASRNDEQSEEPENRVGEAAK
jgi:hypothetical protein